MNYKAIIIDDEAPARNLIRSFLEGHPRVVCAGEACNGLEAARMVLQLKPDLVFLDIEMPRVNGLEMVELIEGEYMPLIVFVTAYDQYAMKAFEKNAVDYLLKPVSQERFDLAVNRVLDRLDIKHDHALHIKQAVDQIDQEKEQISRIVVRDNQGIHVIAPSEVLMLEAADDYVMIYTSTARYIKKKTLGFYERCLDPATFARIHRSYIVNITGVKRIEPYSKDAWVAILANGMKASVSKQGYQLLRKTFDF